jgi:hypothetical protein
LLLSVVSARLQSQQSGMAQCTGLQSMSRTVLAGLWQVHTLRTRRPHLLSCLLDSDRCTHCLLTCELQCGVVHHLWHWCVVGLKVVGVEGADVHKGAQPGHLAGQCQQLPSATVVGPVMGC